MRNKSGPRTLQIIIYLIKLFSSQDVKTFLIIASGWLGLKSSPLTLSWLTKHDTIIRNIARDNNLKKRCCQNHLIFIQRDLSLVY